jgi:hypothetical protein
MDEKLWDLSARYCTSDETAKYEKNPILGDRKNVWRNCLKLEMRRLEGKKMRAAQPTEEGKADVERMAWHSAPDRPQTTFFCRSSRSSARSNLEE